MKLTRIRFLVLSSGAGTGCIRGVLAGARCDFQQKVFHMWHNANFNRAERISFMCACTVLHFAFYVGIEVAAFLIWLIYICNIIIIIWYTFLMSIIYKYLEYVLNIDCYKYKELKKRFSRKRKERLLWLYLSRFFIFVCFRIG